MARGSRWYRDDVLLAFVGTTELLIILLVILVLFGGAKLPKLARSLGQAQGEFKKGLDEGDSGDTAPRTEPRD